METKIIKKFGNWIVDEDGISYTEHDYDVSKDSLNDVFKDDDRNKFDWLIHIASKTWLSRGDLNGFNEAYKFALDYFNVEHNLDWEESLRVQSKEFNYAQRNM